MGHVGVKFCLAGVYEVCMPLIIVFFFFADYGQ